MFRLDIFKADGSAYWTEHFNDQASAQAWLDSEKQRPYWKSEFTTTTTDLTPPPVVLSPDEQVQRDRQAEYNKEGVTVDNMIVALWEKVIENRPESADALQAKRVAVKAKIPKANAS